MSEPTAADRRARIAVSAIFFVNGCALGGYVSHLADFQQRLGLTDGGLGRCLLFSSFGAITSMPFSGPLIHRFGSRNLALIGALLLSCATVFLTLAPSVPLLCLALYFVGASNGQCDVGMNAHSMVVQDRFPRPILSAVHGWFSIGGFAGGAGAALAGRLGLNSLDHLLVAAVVLIATVLVASRGLYSSHVDRESEGPKFVLPTLPVLMLGLLLLFAFVSEGAMWDWSAVYLRNVLQSERVMGSLGFGLASFSMAIGRFVGDSIVHRFGYRRTLFASSLVTGVGILAAVNIPSVPGSIAGFCLAGIGLANLVPILFRAGAKVPGIPASVGLAAITTCGYTGFLLGPPVIGMIADHRGLSFSLGLTAALCLGIAASTRRATRNLE